MHINNSIHIVDSQKYIIKEICFFYNFFFRKFLLKEKIPSRQNNIFAMKKNRNKIKVKIFVRLL